MRFVWAVVSLCGCGESLAEIDEGDELLGGGAEYSALELPESGVLAGDLVRLGELVVLVPARGESVALRAHLEGGTRELTLSHGADGVVALAAGDAATAGSTGQGACDDGAFATSGPKWEQPLRWWFRASTTPSANSKTGVEHSLERAAATVAEAKNDCGLTSTLRSRHEYLGRTDRGTNIPNSKTQIACGARDQHNVIAFGTLPDGTVGLTCSWWSGGVVLEADIKLDKSAARWFATPQVPDGCSGKLSVEAVAAHELGHAFGLGHVSEAEHGALTMSTHTTACSIDAVTLGKGDVLGLRALY